MITVRPLVPGSASGTLLLLSRPLSLWGGLDPHSGLITETTHPDVGRCVKGCLLVMEEARGSSSSASILVEAARNNVAPAGIILMRRDPILTIGSMVSALLYGREIPIALVDADDWPVLQDGMAMRLDGALLSPA